VSAPSYYRSRLRHAAYDEIAFSPHLDDAVYSLAGTLLAAREAGRRVLVVTVFGHGQSLPPAGTGIFDDYASREREDHAAMLALDADYVWLNLPELMFRGSTGRARLAEVIPHGSFAGTPVLEQVRRAMGEVALRFADHGATIHLPLAVGAHPDHRIVHEALLFEVQPSDAIIRFYEDVPYALETALVESRLAVLRALPGPGVLSVARGLARLAFRGIGRAIALLPLFFYLACTETLRRYRSGDPKGDASRRSAGELSMSERDIGAFVARKADAMRLYRSQTPLFFENEAQLAQELPCRDGIFVERSWRFAS
jgi:LmbE family N-acetylglucosaminyl deacetylase